MKTLLALSLAMPIAAAGCISSNPSDPTADDLVDGKADGIVGGTYFACSGLGTNNTVWMHLGSKSVVMTVEGAGVNTGKLTTSDSGSQTFSGWTSKVFFGAGDTLVVPTSLKSHGSGKVVWNVANVNPYWEGTCTKKTPTGDQCLPLVDQIYPVDSSARAKYATVSSGQYTVTIPDSTVGDFSYDVTMHKSGILCTQGAVTSTSCSAIVADKIGEQAFKDGSSSGSPYVTTRTKAGSDYSWSGGVHDAESGEFAYTVTTDSNADGCNVTKIVTVSP